MNNNYLFIIPARSKSKRLTNKNLKNFNGKPLLFWSIEQSMRFKKYGSTLVTSDSNYILKKCSVYKDVLLVKRPSYLATDNASLIDVAKHAAIKLSFIKNIIILQPTSPLRKDIDIKKGISIFNKAVFRERNIIYFI